MKISSDINDSSLSFFNLPNHKNILPWIGRYSVGTAILDYAWRRSVQREANEKPEWWEKF